MLELHSAMHSATAEAYMRLHIIVGVCECSIADAASELPQSSLLSPGRGRQLPKGKGVVVAGEGREKPMARCCACAACNACTQAVSRKELGVRFYLDLVHDFR